MKKAMWRPVADDRRAADLAVIAAAVDNAALVPAAAPTIRRRLSVVAVAAGLFVLPAGIAIAAEGSLPGDALYPVKRVTETVRSWIDDDLPAQHRVEELEKLMAADASDDVIADQVRRATDAVDELAVDHDLRPRLAGATSTAAGDRGGPARGGGPGPGVTPSTVPPTGTTSVTSRPSDRPESTTTTILDTATTTLVDATTTTTAATTTTVRPNGETHRVIGSVHAGPTCPVERFPPDPDCADQPVAGAVLVITDEGGSEVARLVSNQDGRFQIRLPNGVYQLHPQPYDGLLGTAPMQEFVVEAGPLELDVAYDTGIR
jgi:hypothetical protein